MSDIATQALSNMPSRSWLINSIDTRPGLIVHGAVHLGAARISVLGLGSPVGVSTLRAVIGESMLLHGQSPNNNKRNVMPSHITLIEIATITILFNTR